MNKENYKPHIWYPLTDNEYWVDYGEYPDFPNHQTLVFNTANDGWYHTILSIENCSQGWGAMAKQGTWMFMIVEKPKM